MLLCKSSYRFWDQISLSLLELLIGILVYDYYYHPYEKYENNEKNLQGDGEVLIDVSFHKSE